MSPVDYSTHSLDALIKCFVRGEDPLQRGLHQLASTMDEKCREIARREICRQLDLSQSSDRELLEDAVTDVLERMWAMLCKAQRSGDENVIRTDAEALVRSIAHRSLADRFRDRKPGHYRLLCAVRYILDECPERLGITTCRRWSGAVGYGLADATRNGNPRAWDKPTFQQEMLHYSEPQEISLPTLVCAILEWHGHPMTRQEIVGCVTDLLGDQDPAAISLDAGRAGDEWPASYVTDYDGMDAIADLTQAMRWLWSEIVQLPEEQCRSVLMRMDSSGLEAMAVEVGYEAVAQRLGISEDELLKLIDKLPLEFEYIGQELGISSQQARSRRARGWNRIERRYRKWHRKSGKELGLLSRWISLLDRSSSDGRSARETT